MCAWPPDVEGGAGDGSADVYLRARERESIRRGRIGVVGGCIEHCMSCSIDRFEC